MLRPSRLLPFTAVALLVFSSVQVAKPRPEPRFAGPSSIVWAWERPEDLRFLAGHKIGVAYLAKTFFVGQEGFAERPRMQSLEIAPDAWLMAVVRIEAKAGSVRWKPEQIDDLAGRIAALASTPGVRAVQVDFDATASQREFYRELLTRLRKRLPPGTALSITALVSWCVEDTWVRTLPVDEAVPMLFRMGTGALAANEYLRAHGDFEGTACAGSVGISTDERWRLERASRTYVFSDRQWSERQLRALPEVRR